MMHQPSAIALVAGTLVLGGCVASIGDTNDLGAGDDDPGADARVVGDGGDASAPGDPRGTGGDVPGGDGDEPAGDAGGTVGEVVHLFGRFDTRDPLIPECAWTACGFGVTFRGPSLDIELSGAGGIGLRVVLDGTPDQRLVTQGSEWSWHESSAVYTVVSGLADTEHQVELWREPEAMFGPLRFHGFIPAAGGALLPSPPPFTRRLEIDRR